MWLLHAAMRGDRSGGVDRRRIGFGSARARAILMRFPRIAIGLSTIGLALACQGGASPSVGVGASPGVEARIRVSVTSVAPASTSSDGRWNVTFNYNGHMVTAPTAPGLAPSSSLVGRDAIIDGSVGHDGSFTILSISPAN